MENLLIPQVCMNIDDTPLDVGDTSDDSSSESNEPEIGDDAKVKLLLEGTHIDSSQVPEELTEFEKEAKRNVFALGEPAVQFQRLHCTACNLHLGSAPIGHFNRYIHPLLKVLLCKSCYEFYCSGEFDKDEDGSEMYCRWCGQGGKVMCCAQCAYVFCQKCVRQNLGKRTLELIKDSDDWLCFGCNPTQLINLKIICTSLYEFVQEEIRLSKSLNNIERLKVDHSVCCQKTKAAKRKRDEDILYTPHMNDREESKAKKPSILKSTLSKPLPYEETTKTASWDKKEEAEVVCTPDLLALMEDDPPPLVPAPKEGELNARTSLGLLPRMDTNNVALNKKPQFNTPQKAIRSDGKKLYTIAPKMMVCNSNVQKGVGSNVVRLQSPGLKFVPTVNRLVPIVNSVPAQIIPGTKHEWYDKAAGVISSITSNVSVTLTNLTREQRHAKSVEQLANVHNKLQELLSSSVNSLIQVRKNLRTEFLDDLNKLKFSSTFSFRHNNNKAVIKPNSTYGPANNENIVNDDDDDDVIVIAETPTKPLMEPPPLVKIASSEVTTTRPYLKVRSVSQLLTVSSECITIPDDPPAPSTIEPDLIPIEEEDPLEKAPDLTNQAINQIEDDVVTVIEKTAEIEVPDTIAKKNALTEKRIEQFIEEYMRLQVYDVSQEELKRILAVRVLISTNFGEALPSNRLKASIPDDADVISIGTEEKLSEIEENQPELANSDVEIGAKDVSDVQNDEEVAPPTEDEKTEPGEDMEGKVRECLASNGEKNLEASEDLEISSVMEKEVERTTDDLLPASQDVSENDDDGVNLPGDPVLESVNEDDGDEPESDVFSAKDCATDVIGGESNKEMDENAVD